MIVKMKFLSISGPRTDIDRVTSRYLSKYEMQLENAITELKTTDNLLPFMDLNPYKEPLAKAEQYAAMLPDQTVPMDTSLSADEMIDLIRNLNHDYLDMKAKEEKIKKQKKKLWKTSSDGTVPVAGAECERSDAVPLYDRKIWKGQPGLFPQAGKISV